MITQDWSTGMFGLTVGERSTLGTVMVAEKARAREDAEQRRLFYVGMTRAKDRLVLSGGLPARRSRGSFLELLEEAAGGEIGRQEQSQISIGPAMVTQTVLLVKDRRPSGMRDHWHELHPAPDCREFVDRWDQREKTWRLSRSTPVQLTPSRLMATRQSLPSSGRALGSESKRSSADLARLIGTLAHRLLQSWDFHAEPLSLRASVSQVCRSGLPAELADQRALIEDELHAMLEGFSGSAAYADLRRGTILGREVPFAIPWESPTLGSVQACTQSPGSLCVMEGVIDVLYHLDGRTCIADYKTDQVPVEQIAQRAEDYRVQASVYRRATMQCLGVENVEVRIIFLRTGQAVELVL